jgi:dihydroorotate dehydrogenase
MLHTPYYDPKKTYEENYNKGPFGRFAEKKIYKNNGEPKYKLFGYPVYLPFGIPAGPVLNSKFVRGAFNSGFDLVVYKTVRSQAFSCHPYPNVLPVKLRGDLTITATKKPLVVEDDYKEPLSITNSFGVPSKKPSQWQKDVKKGLTYEKKGQLLILSFMGTVRPNQTEEEFVDDFALAAKQALATGAKAYEVNLSCPNIGNEGLVCYNLRVTEKVLKKIRKVLGDKPLIVKIGYFSDDKELKKFAEIVENYAQAIAAINTIAASVVDKHGNQALPGSPVRLRSGICGAGIKWAGIEMVKRLSRIKKDKKYSFSIFGIGGVFSVNDYFDYKKAGADVVMSATGSMWNPYLAEEIKKEIY